jgi:hypothetical protein
MAMGLSESRIASDKRRSETLGKRDVHRVSERVSASEMVGALHEWLCGPTPNWQAQEVCDSDESLVVADQSAHNRSPYRPDYFDIEVGRGM